MVRAAAVAAALLLAGCGRDEFQTAKERYDFLKANHAPQAEKCAQARRVADIAAARHLATDYTLWRVTADNDCNAQFLGMN